VAKLFAELGAHVVDADKIVHDLYRKGEPVHRELVERFGAEILRPDGEIDRPRLASLAFEGGRVQELNRIVHPAVFRSQQEWMANAEKCDPNAVAVVEATLILESGGRAHYDKIVAVVCRPEQKVARYAGRSGIPLDAARSEVDRRTKAQFSDEEKARQADYVIDNSGSLEATRQQVERIYRELSSPVRRAAE
jgi:dephospho-CoA kinase